MIIFDFGKNIERFQVLLYAKRSAILDHLKRKIKLIFLLVSKTGYNIFVYFHQLL